MFSLGSPKGDFCQTGKVSFSGATEVNTMSHTRRLSLSYKRVTSWGAVTKLAPPSKCQLR